MGSYIQHGHVTPKKCFDEARFSRLKCPGSKLRIKRTFFQNPLCSKRQSDSNRALGKEPQQAKSRAFEFLFGGFSEESLNPSTQTPRRLIHVRLDPCTLRTR